MQLAAIVTATSLLGGAAAGMLGQNASAAMTAAQNETLNNTCAPGHNCGTLTSAIKIQVARYGIRRLGPLRPFRTSC